MKLFGKRQEQKYGRLDKAMAQMILAKMYLNAQVYIGTPKYIQNVWLCALLIAGGYVLKLII
jgi:hypothetical protein